MSRADPLSFGTAARTSFEFDCIDADFSDDVAGGIGVAFDMAVTKPFAVLRILTTFRRFEEVAGYPALPGSWFELSIQPEPSVDALITWHSQLQPSGFPSHARGVTTHISYLGTDEPSAAPSPRPQSLGAAVVKQAVIPSAVIAACAMPAANAANSLTAILGSIAGFASLRVRDVGQASFLSLCDVTGRALLHYDVGLPISFNGHTAPKRFNLNVNEKPPIVLSHWDWDHLHAGLIFPHLLDCTWIVPDQKLGPGAARLAHILAKRGNLLVHPAATRTRLRWGEITQATGGFEDSNNAGLTTLVTLDNGKTVLLTGDADYLFVKHSGLENVDYLVATHHGASFDSGSATVPRPKVGEAKLFLSYGLRNVYRHPHPQALMHHKRAGWNMHLATASRPRGDLIAQ